MRFKVLRWHMDGVAVLVEEESRAPLAREVRVGRLDEKAGQLQRSHVKYCSESGLEAQTQGGDRQ